MAQHTSAGLGCDGAFDNVFNQPIPHLDSHLEEAYAMQLSLQSHGLHNQTEQPSGLNTGESARNAADLDASQNLDRPSQGTELQAPPTSSISDNHSTPLPTYPFSRSPRRSSRGSTLHEYHRTLMEMEIERRRTAPASYSPENVFRSHPVPPRAQRVERLIYHAFTEVPPYVSSMLRRNLRSNGIRVPFFGHLRIGTRPEGVLGFRGARMFVIQGTLTTVMPIPVPPPLLNRICPRTGDSSADGTYRRAPEPLVDEEDGVSLLRSSEYAIIHAYSPPPWYYVLCSEVPEDSGLAVHMRSLGREAGFIYIVPRGEMVRSSG